MSHRGKRSQSGKQKQQKRAVTFEEAMVEKDTARAIVKNLCQRDQLTGDIVYTGKNDPAIHDALLGGKFCIIKELPNSKHLQTKTEKIWGNLDGDVIDKTLERLEVGEVMNRPGEPCWWR